MAWVMASTNHKNYHSRVETYHDVALIVNIIVAGNVFQEQLSCDLGKKKERKNTDLFSTGSAKLSLGLTIQDYKDQYRGNWVRGTSKHGNNNNYVLFKNNLKNFIERSIGENSTNVEYNWIL